MAAPVPQIKEDNVDVVRATPQRVHRTQVQIVGTSVPHIQVTPWTLWVMPQERVTHCSLCAADHGGNR